jgi:hypothetical protein
LLDLLADLRFQRANKIAETISIEALWYNTFSRTVGQDRRLEDRLRAAVASASINNLANTSANMTLKGIHEAQGFTPAARDLCIPVIRRFINGLISADETRIK